MDIVTHGLVGALVGRAVAPRATGAALAAVVAGALVPDLDVVARLWDPLAPITVHRTATHSLLGGLALALAVAGLCRVMGAAMSIHALAALAYAGALSHIGLDLLTPFGTAVLWPWDGWRFGLGWLYVIDPVVIGVTLAALLGTAGRQRAARPVAVGALGALTAYVFVAGLVMGRAEQDFLRLLQAERIAATRTVLVPTFPGPLRWLGVAETDDAVYRVRFFVGRRPEEPLAVFPKLSPEPPLSSEEAPAMRAFRSFARVPWGAIEGDGDARTLVYRDLAFEDHPFGGEMALWINLDRSGTVRAVRLGHTF
jgi:membrane-bound metal-dependent hydrolase YbcI (DUF457 family)